MIFDALPGLPGPKTGDDIDKDDIVGNSFSAVSFDPAKRMTHLTASFSPY